MTKAFHTNNPAGGSGETNTWYTPKSVLDALAIRFSLDPCTNSTRPFNTAARHICHDVGGDGLNLTWNGTVWLNPPYGRDIGMWLDKLADHGDGVALVFSRTETAWAQSAMAKADGVTFMRRRISFMREAGDDRKSTSAANGSMLLAYGDKANKAIKNIDGLYATLAPVPTKLGE